MKIKIMGKPVAKASMDLNKFKQLLSKTWDIGKSVKESIKVTYEGELKADFIKETMYQQTEWEMIIKAIGKGHTETDISLFPIEYTDWVKYTPKNIEGGECELQSESINDQAYLIVYSCLDNIGLSVKTLFAKQGFTFGSMEWKKVVTYE
jgi:hypothetical protein